MPYYNGHEFSDISSVSGFDNYQYHTMVYLPYKEKYYVCFSKYAYCVDENGLFDAQRTGGGCKVYEYTDGSWEKFHSGTGYWLTNYTLEYTEPTNTCVDIIWASYDIVDVTTGDTCFAGSEPTDSLTTITGITITAPVNVTRGKYHNITVAVNGEGEFDDSTVCNVHGATSAGTTLKASSTKNVYVLYVDPQETAETLEIYATSVQDPDVTASTTCNVKSVWVQGIKISTPRDYFLPGEVMYCTISAYGDDGCLPYAYEVSLSGNTSTSTSASKNGGESCTTFINFGEDETAESLTITATSTQDSSISTTKKILKGYTGDGSGTGGTGSGGTGGDSGGDSGDGPGSGSGSGSGGEDGEDTRNGVTEIVISTPAGAVKPGGSATIEYKVKGVGSFSDGVNIELSGDFDSSYTVDQYGYKRITVHIGANEKADSVTLTLTSVEDEDVKASTSISVDYDTGDDSGGSGGSDDWEDEVIAEVTEIALTGLQSSVKPGAMLTVGVVVDGVGDYDDGWKVSVSGNVSSNTYATKSTDGFKLKIGSNETAESITVTVTSTANKTVYTEETIFVEQPEESDPPDDEVIENETATKEAIIEARKMGFYAGFQTAAAMYCKG